MTWFRHDPLDTVESALKRHSFKYARADKHTILSGFGMPSCMCMVGIRHDESKKTVLFLFHPSRTGADVLTAVLTGQQMFIRVHTGAGHTKEQVAQVCELLLDENYRIVLGSFERDQADGELRFRIALPYRAVNISEEQVDWCLQVGLATVEVVMQKVQALLAAEQAAGPMQV